MISQTICDCQKELHPGMVFPVKDLKTMECVKCGRVIKTITPKEDTKETQLWHKLVYMKIFNSHQVREIGFQMFYDRADRTVRRWAEIGRIKRISPEECILRNLNKKGNAPLAWWEV